MKQAITTAGIGLTLAVSSVAAAQTDERYDETMYPPVEAGDVEVEGERRAPENAFEIGIMGGYTQPFGDLAENQDLRTISDAGGAVGIDIGYRFNPYMSMSILTQYHEQVVGGDFPGEADLRGFASTLQGTAHFLPYDTVDPYLTFGSGYRGLWVAPAGSDNDSVFHAIQLARVTFGVDFRVSESVAMGPLAGADMNLFLWESFPGLGESGRVDDPRVSTFLFAGLAGRFDIGGRRVGRDRVYVPVAAR